MGRMTLRAARVNAGLKQKEAAKALGIGNKTLSSWENGLSIPRGDKIDAICALYNATYDEIIFFNKENA